MQINPLVHKGRVRGTWTVRDVRTGHSYLVRGSRRSAEAHAQQLNGPNPPRARVTAIEDLGGFARACLAPKAPSGHFMPLEWDFGGWDFTSINDGR